MAVKLSPFGPKPAFWDSSGNPLSGGKLYFFQAGSTTAQNTYTDSTGGSANANPVVLNARGEPTNEIWFTTGLTYKAVLKTSADVTIWSVDNITAINDVSALTADEWLASGLTPTFASATSFTLAGDQTTEFHIGRRVKSSNSGGTIYSTISASAFGALTTVTVVNDSGVLDSGLSAVNYGIVRATNPSIARLNGNLTITGSATLGDSTGDGHTVNGTVAITTSGSLSSVAITDTGAFGANVLLNGNGATTPKKYIRAADGKFSIVNDGYTLVVFQVADNGSTYINETSNVNQTLGLTINQGAADDEILALKSSDVTHGITDLAETDTYGDLQKDTAASGGVKVRGLSASTRGVHIDANVAAANGTKGTGAVGCIQLNGAAKSGTGVAALAADGNIVAVSTNGTTRFILDGEGDSHQDAGRTLRAAGGAADDTGVGWTNYDSINDIHALDALAVTLAREGDPLREMFLQSFAEQRAVLEAIPGKPIVTFNDGPGQDGHAFVNMSRLTMLLTGAVRQLGRENEELRRRLDVVMLALEAK